MQTSHTVHLTSFAVVERLGMTSHSASFTLNSRRFPLSPAALLHLPHTHYPAMMPARRFCQAWRAGWCGRQIPAPAVHLTSFAVVEPLGMTSHSARFTLNGRRFPLEGCDPNLSLLRWLRAQHLTGTKEGCGDGDCGACTVAMVETDGAGASRYVAVNSCLLPLGLLPGREVVTVEALAEGENLHPVQQAMVDCAGSQCGYCTPGFVMSLFAGWHGQELSDHTTEGNLCRCTGYRSIRAATAQAKVACVSRAPDRFDALLQQARGPLASQRLQQWFSPVTLAEAIALKQQHADASWIAGATDLGVNLSHGKPVANTMIALDRIVELQALVITETHVRIGAGVPLSRIEHELAGLFPPLDEMLPWFAARQVRNRATFGGNLGSASPIGDLAPVLLALDARVELFGANGSRTLALEHFFTAYRKTLRLLIT